jgi:hypothetical protein
LTEEKQLRPIWAEIDYYLQFTDLPYLLEETQALATATLGTSREANRFSISTR